MTLDRVGRWRTVDKLSGNYSDECCLATWRTVIGSPRVLRAMNERAALYALLRHGAMSRVELDHAIGLSKPAAAELLRRLEASGLACRSRLQSVHRHARPAQF